MVYPQTQLSDWDAVWEDTVQEMQATTEAYDARLGELEVSFRSR